MENKTIDIILNNTEIKFEVFNYEYYKSKYDDQKFTDESVGLDIISFCIENDKCWEPFQTEITKEILNENKDGLFIDVGCQLGYYSSLSSLLNIKTISIDFCDYFLDLFRQTIETNNLKNITIINQEVNEDFKLFDYVNDNDIITLIKIDIEGSEKFLIESIKEKLSKNLIKNIIIEISPKINNSYIELCKLLYKNGYLIYDIGLSHQRQLNQNTNHLQNIENLIVDIDNIEEYINNLEHGQSNFLFR
tara:strand:- start:3082 stop:3825 length:744 start_codon:yes stop_codon:yes gene_type:complete